MNHSVVGFYIGADLANADLLMAAIGELIGFVASGQVKIQVGTVLPLSRAAEAHRLLVGRQTTGKVVLQPWAHRLTLEAPWRSDRRACAPEGASMRSALDHLMCQSTDRMKAQSGRGDASLHLYRL
ncbi:zinc-binding dehydrogenase [Rhizobium sp. AN80A]|uniref:zinc-binding dehydrogenase n=1 Tax=Rhizobium sp. AN80A TaxID=3040673 RepID=UPI000DBFE959|nr:zinc-binding dehydrogenase [Rhizobium sp. AN80A]